MTRTIATIAALASPLTGCGNAEADAAAQLVNEARSIYEGRAKGSPGKLPGNFVLGREDIGRCVEQMEMAHTKLKQVKSDYPTTEAATSSETRRLENAVVSQLGTCRSIKQKQGW
ncbi:hypothetical protein [Pseudomonas veronii]|uniref:hypothetical protein n=1 Tax=Pseudomonas veronii TaxID=76761 RepID=UPI000A3E3F31|nr:hypothetical protein [Pseudomonas veronii]